MTTLFTAAELAAFLQRPVADDQYDSVHGLVLDALQGEAGGRITDPPQTGVKSVAIAVAARALTNPSGLRSASAGEVSESYSDAFAGITLTATELKRLRRAVGLSSGAGMLNIAPTDDGCWTPVRRPT